MNKDGSTNNISEYYSYCRDYKIKKFGNYYVSQLIWAFIASNLTYYITVMTLGNIMG